MRRLLGIAAVLGLLAVAGCAWPMKRLCCPGMVKASIRFDNAQLAGPQGAIITEVANVHTNDAVRHCDPKANDHFLGKRAQSSSLMTERVWKRS